MEKSVRVHRVGTVTFGCILIVFGSLFLAHVFIPVLSYAFIFRLWPFILILLGVEVLWGIAEQEGQSSRKGNYGSGSSMIRRRLC